MMLITPILAGSTNGMDETIWLLLAKAIGIIIFVIVSAKWVVPQLLHQVVKTNNSEIFLLSVATIGLAVAWLTNSVGLSLALGAFLAGLIISESEYSHQALGNILPFRDVFTSFFFVSIGMLLDVNFFLQQPILIIFVALAVLLVKAMIAGLVTQLLGFPLRIAIIVGLGLSQVGEFSFILSRTGVEHGLLSGNVYQLFLSVAILTMAVTPFVIAYAPKVATAILRLPLPKKLSAGIDFAQEEKRDTKKDHLVVIGYGLNGKNVVRAASNAKISYEIIEMNPDTVRIEREKGEPIYFGDATQEAVLELADIEDARVLVVAISDPIATRAITELARRLNPKVYIIVRTRYLQELKPLYELGANEVIPEEFETSVEIFSRVLSKYLVPRDEIEEFIAVVRADNYEMFRSLSKQSPSAAGLKLRFPGIDIGTFKVSKNSFIAGKTLSEVDLRRKYGVTLLAIERDSSTSYNPHGDKKICVGDLLVVIGLPAKITEVTRLFRDKKKCSETNL